MFGGRGGVWNDAGLVLGLASVFQQQQFDGYVQAFMGQGYTFEAAQAAARQALGIRPPSKAWYLFLMVMWLGAAALGIAVAVTVIAENPGAGIGGAVVIPLIGSAVAGFLSLRNLLQAII